MRNVDIHQIESLLLILSLTGIASRKIRTAIYGRTVSVVAKDFARSFYSSKAWQDCRNEYAKSVHHLCENCMRKGIYRPGVIVHHIEELTPMNIHRPEVTLNFDNLELLCRECHAEQHMERSKGRRYVFGDGGEIILK